MKEDRGMKEDRVKMLNGDFVTSAGEILRRSDVAHAERHPRVAGYRGQQLARKLLGMPRDRKLLGMPPAPTLAAAGWIADPIDARTDAQLVDELHDLIGLRLDGVREHAEGHVVRLRRCSSDQRTFALEARNEGGYNATEVDAADLVAWILSPTGRAALGRRGIHVDGMIDAARAAQPIRRTPLRKALTVQTISDAQIRAIRDAACECAPRPPIESPGAHAASHGCDVGTYDVCVAALEALDAERELARFHCAAIANDVLSKHGPDSKYWRALSPLVDGSDPDPDERDLDERGVDGGGTP